MLNQSFINPHSRQHPHKVGCASRGIPRRIGLECIRNWRATKLESTHTLIHLRPWIDDNLLSFANCSLRNRCHSLLYNSISLITFSPLFSYSTGEASKKKWKKINCPERKFAAAEIRCLIRCYHADVFGCLTLFLHAMWSSSTVTICNSFWSNVSVIICNFTTGVGMLGKREKKIIDTRTKSPYNRIHLVINRKKNATTQKLN